MQFYPHRTVYQQANRLPEELREAYKKSQIDRITIFDGKTEIELTGYAEYSYIREKSYKTQPVRTQDGKIQEIEQYATFFTPRLVIKYNMMGIEDYRRLMRLLKRRNGFIVKCYDVEEDVIVREEMYVATPSMPRIYQQYLMALGIQEYSIELIGTNVPIYQREQIDLDINGTENTAFFGQTWQDWVDSAYNKDGYTIEETEVFEELGTRSIMAVRLAGTNLYVYDDCRTLVEADQYVLMDTMYELNEIW